jgi:hypothetical protein
MSPLRSTRPRGGERQGPEQLPLMALADLYAPEIARAAFVTAQERLELPADLLMGWGDTLAEEWDRARHGSGARASSRPRRSGPS